MVLSEPDADYPRPQLRRLVWVDLGGEWEFDYDDGDVGRADGWSDGRRTFSRRIVVPYPPESPRSGVGDTSFHRVLWYQRPLPVETPPPGERVLLHFGAVDYSAEVWVNGREVGRHEGGHTPFTVDVSGALEASGNVLTVRAVDDPREVTQPRGKQDWRAEPHAIWYHRTSGIWQPVWLETVPDVHLEHLTWRPDPANARVLLQVRLSEQPPAPVRLDVRLTAPGGDALAEYQLVVDADRAEVDIAIPALRHGQDTGRLLWTPETPNLVGAEVSLGSGDRVTSYLGLRSVGFRDGRFLLNSVPYYLRLVLEQGYWPESHLAAPDGAALRAEVEAIRALGFNGARIHQKVEDPRFLAWCDRLGLLVWDEMPSAYEYGDRTVHRLIQEWSEVIDRDISHPCVVTWVPLNESWGVPHIAVREDQQHLASALYHLTKALDPSRPVVSNDGWEHTRSDLWTVHDYTPDAASLRERFGDAAAIAHTLRGAGPGRRKVLLEDGDERGQPVILSEFGGFSYAPEQGEDWFGYGVVGTSEEFLRALDDLVGAVLDCEAIAGFCYTQLTDTMQERNGLLTEHRVPKLPVDELHASLTRPSRAIPAEAVDAHRRRAKKEQR